MPVNQHKIDKINTRSEFFQDILDKVPSAIVRWDNTAILVIFILIAIGLTIIKYPDTIPADAIITTEAPPVEAFSRTSGSMIRLLKKDQDTVKKGDWVIAVNSSVDYENVTKLMSLIKSVDGNNFWESINQIPFTDSLNLGTLQGTYQKLLKSIGEFNLLVKQNAQQKHREINSDRQQKLASIEKELNNQLPSLEREYKVSEREYERYKKLESVNVVSKSELEQKEIVMLNSKNKLEDFKNNMINNKLQSGLLKKETVTLETEGNNTLFTIKSNILDSYNSLLSEIREWQDKYIISAPVDGTLNLFEIRTENQFIANEQKVFTVVQSNKEQYFAILKLATNNAGKVRVGQKCIIKLNNYSYAEFGTLSGTIASISNVTKEGFYKVKVDMPDQLVTNLHKKLTPASELIGQSEIITEDLTLFQRIFNSLISKKY